MPNLGRCGERMENNLLGRHFSEFTKGSAGRRRRRRDNIVGVRLKFKMRKPPPNNWLKGTWKDWKLKR